MSRLSAILPAILLPLALAACFPRPDYTDLPDVQSIPRSVELLDSVTVADVSAPTSAERAAIAAALVRGGDRGLRVKVRLPQAMPLPSESEARARVSTLGIDPAIAVVEQQTVSTATVVEVLRVTLGVPDCAAMVTPSEYLDGWMRPNMSFGCATHSNLSRMITDPADLVRGRSYGGEGGVAAAQGADRYNRGEVMPLRRTTSVGGVGSTGGGSTGASQ